MPEKRRVSRQKVFLKGRINFNNGASSFDCLVRDMSGAGAKLALSETAALPEVFELYVPQKDRTYRAALRWRRDDGVGVAFGDETRAEPAPAPASAPAGAEASVSLLLRRVSELEAENAVLRRLLADVAAPAQAGAA